MIRNHLLNDQQDQPPTPPEKNLTTTPWAVVHLSDRVSLTGGGLGLPDGKEYSGRCLFTSQDKKTERPCPQCFFEEEVRQK